MSESIQQPAVAGAAQTAIPAAGSAAGRKCFVIDDDAGICKALSFTLKRLGFQTSEIATPAALAAALREHNPDLVFLDLSLGQAGAMDILPMLEEHGYRGPVQLMSGRSQGVLDEVVTAGEGFGLNMLPALTKPFRMGVVKDLVAGLGFPAPETGQAA